MSKPIMKLHIKTIGLVIVLIGLMNAVDYQVEGEFQSMSIILVGVVAVLLGIVLLDLYDEK